MLFNVLNDKNCQWRILYTVKFFMNISDKQNWEFSNSIPWLKQASTHNKNNYYKGCSQTGNLCQ